MVVCHLNYCKKTSLDVEPAYCARLKAFNSAHLTHFLQFVFSDANLRSQIALVSQDNYGAILAVPNLFEPSQDTLKSVSFCHVEN